MANPVLARLGLLERLLILVGCATCRHWDDLSICDEHGRCLRDETCPGCGRVVPISERHVFVGIDLEVL